MAVTQSLTIRVADDIRQMTVVTALRRSILPVPTI